MLSQVMVLGSSLWCALGALNETSDYSRTASLLHLGKGALLQLVHNHVLTFSFGSSVLW